MEEPPSLPSDGHLECLQKRFGGVCAIEQAGNEK